MVTAEQSPPSPATAAAPRSPARPWRTSRISRAALVAVLAAMAGTLLPYSSTTSPSIPALTSSLPVALAVAEPPANLPTIAYEALTSPFPADPEPYSREHLTEGVHPESLVAAYDAPGGRPLAFLAPTIRGVPLTMPIVRKESGWVAVLLPSINRAVGWLPPGDWSLVTLRDQVVISRSTHQMTWYRDGAAQQTWTVTLGANATPTPLGRSFILGRSSLPSDVYANTDVFALGSIPENPEALPEGLRGAHTGIHTWHNDATLGQNASDGCIRLTKSGQLLLLNELQPGTAVIVLDESL